mgnify:CR=1 FL=1
MTIPRERVENGGLILFLGLATIGLLLIVSGFIGALLWAALAALLFQPLFQRLLRRWPDRRNLAAAVTLLIITIAVVIPALIVASLVVDQAAGVYGQIRSGQINFASYFRQVHDALPGRLQGWLDNAGFGSFERAQAQLTQAVGNSASTFVCKANDVFFDTCDELFRTGGQSIVRRQPLEFSGRQRAIDCVGNNSCFYVNSERFGCEL